MKIIACDIFRRELAELLEKRGKDLDVSSIDLGLHSHIERLEEALTREAAKARTEGHADIRLLLGRACLPDMPDFAARHGLKILPAANCVAAFVGEKKLRELEAGRTMVITRAWLELWPEQMAKKGGWDPVDFRQHCGHYDRILLLDDGVRPIADEEILNFFELTQVPIEVLPINQDYFKGRLAELLS